MIAKSLIASYRNTHYQMGTGTDAILLQIDQYSAALAKFLVASQQSGTAIISAYNPGSQLQSNEDNLAAHQSLKHCLNHHSYPMIESLNIDPADIWPAEKSFFVSGLDLDTARSLGRQFNQNAIVWIGGDAIPRLILLH